MPTSSPEAAPSSKGLIVNQILRAPARAFSPVELREVLSSNLCRCTGYKNIIKAVRAAADQMKP